MFHISKSHVQLSNLATFRLGSLELALESSILAPSLSNIDGTSLVVEDGSTLSLPGVLTYSGGTSDCVISVDGIGSSLQLNHLTRIVGGVAQDADLIIQAVSHGQLDLSSLLSIDDPNVGDTSYRKIRVLADDSESRIDLSSLKSFVDVNGTSESGPAEWSDLIESNGGALSVSWDGLFVRGVNVIREVAPLAPLAIPVSNFLQTTGNEPVWRQDDQPTIDFTTPASSSLVHRNEWIGGTGDWSEPTNWNNGRVPDVTDTIVIPARAGVTVTISSGVALVGDLDCSTILVLAGGTLHVKGLATITGGFSAGLGSKIIVEGVRGSLTVTGQADINGCDLWALGGGVISLPDLTEYQNVSTANNQHRSIVAEGIGSRIEFPSVTSVTGGTHYDSELAIRALNGGSIDLSAVEQILDPGSGDVRQREPSSRQVSQLVRPDVFGLRHGHSREYRRIQRR